MRIKIIKNVIIGASVVAPGSDHARQIEDHIFDDESKTAANLIRIGCARVVVPDTEQVDTDPVDIFELIKAARQAIILGEVTRSGVPEVKAMEKILGYDITAAQRDLAMDEIRSQDDDKK